ncbi:MAG: hypothetical protein OXJ52_00565 [Oligoflexia bacterium]|nr:hypothetical protein [Oligoflexia bacterium]
MRFYFTRVHQKKELQAFLSASEMQFFVKILFIGCSFLISFMSLGDETSALYGPPVKTKPAGKIQAEYESCKGVDLSSLSEEKKTFSTQKTEGEFCFTCSVKRAFGFGEIKEATAVVQSEDFKRKLKKRVIGQIESKLYQSQVLRACVRGDRNWFSKQKADWPLMKEVCKEKNKELQVAVRKNWSKMRVQLALSAPALREDRILSDTATWFDSTPSHFMSEFQDLPQLSKKEKKQAERLYIETLSKTALDGFSRSEFKRRLKEGKALSLPLSGEKHLTSNDKFRLNSSVKELQKKARADYFEMMSHLPVLGYLQTGNPKRKDLDSASRIGEKALPLLKKMLKNQNLDENIKEEIEDTIAYLE